MSFASEIGEAWGNPPAIYRSAPFWSWNSALDGDRLCRAVESMHQAGMGGFFMHSRYGLKTPYLSREWFHCVSACVEKARELGMKAYLYDEDRWPSGAAGGLVTRENEDYRLQSLVTVPAAEARDGDSIATFQLERDPDGRLTSYQSVEDPAQAPAGADAVAFSIRTAAPSGWHNDGTYLDTMNPDAVAEFIRVTHRAYADRFGKDFGNLIPAIFTDEPNYGHFARDRRTGQSAIPWTAELPREFKRRRGYDLRDHLPELVFTREKGEFSKLRYDYLRTLTELFVENFSMQIGLWCEKHRIALTGHMLAEETLASQISAIGAAMPHYEHMQWPGIDILCDQAEELATAKQCSSVADQLNRPRVLSELYGCTGWDWPLAGHKFVGDWQYAVGVNFRCPHLTHYSLAGGAKRDYPASIFHHSPWWKYYSAVEDYFGRLSLMLTQGKPVRDVLVLHPIESAWAVFQPCAAEQCESFRHMDAALRDLIYALSAQHYDWDFGDESLLAKYAKVSGAGLKVGRMTYRAVVVPPSTTLRATTVAMLRRFLAADGKVLFAGQAPCHVDAQPSEEINELAEKARTCGDATDEFAAALERLLPRRVSITDGGGEFTNAWAMLRSVKGGQVLFVQSHDRRGAHQVQVSVIARRPVVLWDARTGQQIRVRSQVEGDRVTFALDLPPTGSALLTLGVSVPDAVHPPHERKAVRTRQVAGPFPVERTEPNTLPLDYCTYSFGDEEFSAPVPTLRADAEIRRRFGLGDRLGGSHQPWYLYATGVVDTAPRGPCRMRRTFHVTDLPARCALALEQPENYKISVNGRAAPQPAGSWVDEDIRTIDITALLKQGDNEILLDLDYRPDMELENMYLVGEFGVRTLRDGAARPGNVTLVKPPKTLALGSWVGQGLDFYGAAVRYQIQVTKPSEGQRLRISLPGILCTAAAIHVGERTFVLPWAPFAADVTDALTGGTNDVAIEVIGGRKNILGPLHVPWKRWTGPGEFNPSAPDWTDEYLLNDHGLTKPVLVETLEE